MKRHSSRDSPLKTKKTKSEFRERPPPTSGVGERRRSGRGVAERRRKDFDDGQSRSSISRSHSRSRSFSRSPHSVRSDSRPRSRASRSVSVESRRSKGSGTRNNRAKDLRMKRPPVRMEDVFDRSVPRDRKMKPAEWDSPPPMYSSTVAPNTNTVPPSRRGELVPRARSESPPSYFRSLCVTLFPSQVSDSAIKNALFHEFKVFGEINISVVVTGDSRRLGYVNFRRPEDAIRARSERTKLTLFERPLKVDPVPLQSYASKKSFSHGYLADQPNQQRRGRTGAPPAPVSSGGGFRGGAPAAASRYDTARDMDYQRMRPQSEDVRRDYGGYDRGYQAQAAAYSNDSYGSRYTSQNYPYPDDDRVNRTIFVGNLENHISEGELRRVFDRFGDIEDIDVKRPLKPNMGNSYAFIKYANLDEARRAKESMQGQRIGRNVCKVGYGRIICTKCLWVGNLGPGVSLTELEREFDRFGAIRKIDYAKGETFAYILYDSLDAAQAAAVQMRGFQLSNNKRIRVEFAEFEQTAQLYERYKVSPPPEVREYQYAQNYADMIAQHYRMPPEQAVDPWSHYAMSDPYQRDYPPTSWEAEYSRDPYYSQRGYADASSQSRGNSYRGGGGQQTDHAQGRRPRPQHRGREPDDRVEPRRRSLSSSRSDVENHVSLKRDGGGGGGGEKGRKTEKPPKDSGEGGAREKTREKFNDVATVAELSKAIPVSWTGELVLKNSVFPTNMHLIEGEKSVLDKLMVDPKSGKSISLKITQRLRLDQPKLDDLKKRTSTKTSNHCLLLSVPADGDAAVAAETPGAQQRPLRNLVSYLSQKQAAGIISLPVNEKDKDASAVLHAFPPTQFSVEFLQRIAPNLSLDAENAKDDHLVVVILSM